MTTPFVYIAGKATQVYKAFVRQEKLNIFRVFIAYIQKTLQLIRHVVTSYRFH